MKWFAGAFNIRNIPATFSIYFKVCTWKTSFFIIARMIGKAAMPSLTGTLITSELFSPHCFFARHFAHRHMFNYFCLKLCSLNKFENLPLIRLHRQVSRRELRLQPTWFQRIEIIGHGKRLQRSTIHEGSSAAILQFWKQLVRNAQLSFALTELFLKWGETTAFQVSASCCGGQRISWRHF